MATTAAGDDDGGGGANGGKPLRRRASGSNVTSVMGYLSPELHRRLKVYCAAQNVTASAIIVELLAKFLDAKGA